MVTTYEIHVWYYWMNSHQKYNLNSVCIYLSLIQFTVMFIPCKIFNGEWIWFKEWIIIMHKMLIYVLFISTDAKTGKFAGFSLEACRSMVALMDVSLTI